jgi:patatin-like phospholipase/acyl hydrolase
MGLYTACVLAEIEKEIERPIASCFDLIAGTSIGGIIALGLAAEVQAAEIRNAIVVNGPKIFSPKPPPQSALAKKLALASNARHAKYRAGTLRSTIVGLVGETTKVGHLNHRVMVPTVNLTKGAPQVFKTDHHPTFQRDWRVPVIDVALATSAAPTFFPLHKIGGELFADGGLYANSPDHLALHEAEYFLEQRLEDIAILSIGTTTSRFSFSNSGETDLGWMGWMDNQRLPRVMISAQQLNTEYMIGHRLQARYLRIDHQQSPEQERQLALDAASEGAIRDLWALSESSVRENLGKGPLRSFLQHTAVPATFYNRKGP